MPVAYGDFRRAYTLVDRIVMEFLRDPYTQATSGNVRFIFRRRLGGQIVLAEAIRTQTCTLSLPSRLNAPRMEMRGLI